MSTENCNVYFIHINDTVFANIENDINYFAPLISDNWRICDVFQILLIPSSDFMTYMHQPRNISAMPVLKLYKAVQVFHI